MFSRLFLNLYIFIGRHKKSTFSGGLAAVICAVILCFFIPFENNIEKMLPDDPKLIKSLRFLQESKFSDKLIFSVESLSAQISQEEFIVLLNQISTEIESLKTVKIVKIPDPKNIMQGINSFLDVLPLYFNAKTQAMVEKKLKPTEISSMMKRIYQLALTPQSTYMVKFFQKDPLNISRDIFYSLKKMSQQIGYTAQIEKGHILSEDGHKGLIIIDTGIPMTDGFQSKILIQALENIIRKFKHRARIDMIGGHLHTLSNESVIRKDIQITLGFASIVFVLLFVFIFKDLKAIILFILPCGGVIFALNLLNLVYSPLSYFIVGMGGVVAGISVDYGIHIYMSLRADSNDINAVKKVIQPIITSAVTTMGVFFAFFFSSVEGYHQLALFSIFSICICLFLAISVLPNIIRPAVNLSTFRHLDSNKINHKPAFLIVLAWVLLMIFLGISSFNLKIQKDIRQFDGTAQEILDREARFFKMWGGEEQPAIFVIEADSVETAKALNEKMYQEVTQLLGDEEFSSIAPLWPSSLTQSQNIARWHTFWHNNEKKLRKLLKTAGRQYQFTDTAFQPFFSNLHQSFENTANPLDGPFLSQLKNRFLMTKKNSVQLLSFFPDDPDYLSKLSPLADKYTHTFIVSKNSFGNTLSNQINYELINLAYIAVFLIPIVTLILLKSFKLAAYALIPVITGTLSITGLFSLLNIPINAPSLISALVVVGLSVDYGIFMVYAKWKKIQAGTQTAVTMSAVTTIVGAGGLLFAQHPMLHAIGLTLVSGVFFGYVASILVVPSIFSLTRNIEQPE